MFGVFGNTYVYTVHTVHAVHTVHTFLRYVLGNIINFKSNHIRLFFVVVGYSCVADLLYWFGFRPMICYAPEHNSICVFPPVCCCVFFRAKMCV